MLYYKHANKPICEQSNACTKSNSKHSRQQTTNSGPAEHMLAEQKLPKHREAITKQTTCTRFPVKYITTQKFRQISCDYHSTFFRLDVHRSHSALIARCRTERTQAQHVDVILASSARFVCKFANSKGTSSSQRVRNIQP